MKFKAKLTCTIDRNHPDRHCVPDWTPEKELVFNDVYTFSADYSRENAKAYMIRDLSVVAGGGYNTKHIHNVKFEFEEVV